MSVKPRRTSGDKRKITGRITNNRIIKILESRAVAGGVTSVILLVLVGQFVGERVATASSVSPYKQVIVVLFVGISTGYFLGRAAEEGEKDATISFLIGFFGTVFVLTIYLASVSLLTGILAFSMISIFLMYDSEVIKKGEDMDDFISFTIEILAIGLGALAVFHYLSPTIMEWISPILESIPDPMIVGVVSLAAIALLIAVAVKLAPTIRYVFTKLNYYFDSIRNRYDVEEEKRGNE